MTDTTNYLYDGDNLSEEIDQSGNVLARCGQHLGIDQPLSEIRLETASYYQQDGLGSVSSLSNSAGALAQTYTFDAFGNQTASSGALTNPFRYTGREFDPETGIDYYRFRYYDPSAGRFISEDPIRFRGGIDFYAYVRNNPTVNIDPGGLSHRFWGLSGGKCCNTSPHDEWWIDDGIWKRLPAGQCTGTWDDCDGMTCGGGFYYIRDLEGGACHTPGKDCGQFAPRRWTPTDPGPKSMSPKDRGAPTGNAPPPGYSWGK